MDFPKVPEGILGEETTEKTNTELFLSLVGQYFPEAIKDGEVDFTALKEEMGEFAAVSSEHYEFTWAGKQAAKKEAMSDIYGRTLKYKPQDSLNPDTTENIYIEGDNLEALKLLRRNYHGKIKMIYIDPPYNTGSDFVYHDDFSMTEEELAQKSGNVVDGVKFQKNVKDSSTYHTAWLNMMYPRLKLSRELLSDDGVIFISIDDNEVTDLTHLCDCIFGEKNRIAIICHKSRASISNDKIISPNHNFILFYARNIQEVEKIRKYIGLDPKLEGFDYNDNDGRGEYRLVPVDGPGGAKKGNPFYSFLGIEGYWRFSKETMQEKYNEGLVVKKGNSLYQKYFKSTAETTRRTATTWWDDGGLTSTATSKLKALMKDSTFDTPKPLELIDRMLRMMTHYDKNTLILDFFSGSATTAHAVMQLNAEDGGNRKFILVQLPEVCDEKSEAAKAGYRTICEIGKERIRRAAKKIHEDNPDAQFDDGFKVFEVADTNIKWNTADDEEIQKLDETDYGNDKERIDFTKGYTDIDVVYEIMLRQFDIPLSTPIEKMPQVSDRTYIFANAVVVCLEPEITTELIENLAAIEPTPGKFVLRDSAFNDNIELKDVSFRRLSALIQSHQTEEECKSKYNNYTVEFI